MEISIKRNLQKIRELFSQIIVAFFKNINIHLNSNGILEIINDSKSTVYSHSMSHTLEHHAS